jgi:hypothetical protein
MREAVDPVEAATEAMQNEIEKRMRHVAQFVYRIFGIAVEPYVGFESFSGQFSQVVRIAVDLPGLPTLNFVEGNRDDPDSLAFVQQCLACDSLISAGFSNHLGLARILEAPLRRCSRCARYGPTPLVNILGEEE